MHRISISSWHHNEHIIPAFVHYHILASHFAWVIASSCVCVQHTFCSTYLLFFMFAHAWSLCFPLQNKNKQRGGKHEKSWCILSCIYSVPWSNHVGIINPFNLKTKWLNMVPNAWLTRKWCFLEHLNFIITFSMHSLKYARAIHPYEMLLKYWRSELPFLGLWVEPSSCFYEKRFIKSSWSMKVTILQKIGAKDGSGYITASSTAKHI